MTRYQLLLTNDDGWDAPGLAALVELSRGLGGVKVLAPDTPNSYCGHRVTTDRSLDLMVTGEEQYHMSGTPADCVRAAVRAVFAEQRIDWVLSGINRGGNLGVDIYSSGTVAAAREAALFNLPAIAISQYIRRDLELDWAASMRNAEGVIRQLMEEGCEPGTFWNVNLPHLPEGSARPEVVLCEPDRAPLDVRYRREGDRLHYSGTYASRGRTPGRDVDLCFGGAITVSKLHL